MRDIKQLNKYELETLKKQIDSQLDHIHEEEEAERLRKKNYHVLDVEPKYVENFFRMWNLVKAAVSEGEILSPAKLEDIYKKGLDRIPTKPEDVYVCPKCGSMSLYVGQFGRKGSLKMSIQ